MNIKKLIIGTAISAAIFSAMIVPAFAVQPTNKGFDQYGYNNTARNFVGTGSSWCLAGGQAANCVGIYSPDKIVMKWNAQWDACNNAATDSAADCLGAWTDNEWNGNVPGGSGTTDHYKIIWVGPEGNASQYWVAGGYVVWGSYEVIMDQGKDNTGHFWFAHGIPNGYGAIK